MLVLPLAVQQLAKPPLPIVRAGRCGTDSCDRHRGCKFYCTETATAKRTS